MALIDLDREWRPLEHPRPPTHRPHLIRPWLALLLAVLSAVSLTGSVPGIRPLQEVAAIAAPDERTFAVIDGVLYVVQPAGQGSRISAYPLPGARLRWSVLVPVPVDVLWPGVHRVLLGQVFGSGPDTDNQVASLDPATGRLLWIADGLVDVVPATGVALLGVQRGPTVIQAMDLTTGRVLWTRRRDAGTDQLVTESSGRGRVVLQDPDGAARVLDATDGHTVATGRLPATEQVMAMTAGRVFALRSTGPRHLVAYDLATGEEVWQVPLSADAVAVQVCGLALCAYMGNELDLIDPANGRIRWRGVGVTGMVDGDRLISNDPWTVLDLRTGRVLQHLDGWTGITSFGDPEQGLLAAPGGETATLVAALDANGRYPAPRPLGLVPLLTPGTLCQAVPKYLVCHVDTRNVVWRY